MAKQVLIIKFISRALVPAFMLFAILNVVDYLSVLQGPVIVDPCTEPAGHGHGVDASNELYITKTELSPFLSGGTWHCPERYALKFNSPADGLIMVLVTIAIEAGGLCAIFMLGMQFMEERKLVAFMESIHLPWQRASSAATDYASMNDKNSGLRDRQDA